MFKEYRSLDVKNKKIQSSSPESWARNFSLQKKINFFTSIKMFFDIRYKLLHKYFIENNLILDAGCGFGEWVSYLNARGYRSIGLDYSDELVCRLNDSYPDGKWICGRIENIPLEDSSCDGVISWGVIEHNEEGPQSALSEFYRVLKLGGYIIVTVPYQDDLAINASINGSKLHENNSSSVFFQYYMTKEDIIHYASVCGFEVVEIGLHPPVSLGKVFPNFYLVLSDYPKVLRIFIYLFGAFFYWKKEWRFMMYCVCRKPEISQDLRNFR